MNRSRKPRSSEESGVLYFRRIMKGYERNQLWGTKKGGDHEKEDIKNKEA